MSTARQVFQALLLHRHCTRAAFQLCRLSKPELGKELHQELLRRMSGGSYIGELVSNMLVLVGAVKIAERVVREMMGLYKRRKGWSNMDL